MANAKPITRRAVLSAVPAVTVTAVVPVAAATLVPAPEDAGARVRRLAAELVDALSDYDGGAWYAQVYPKGHEFGPGGRRSHSGKKLPAGVWLGFYF